MPNLTFPPGQLVNCPAEMAPPLKRGDKASILTNHVQGAETYQECSGAHNALVRTVCAQRGVTINGGEPAALPECKAERDVKQSTKGDHVQPREGKR